MLALLHGLDGAHIPKLKACSCNVADAKKGVAADGSVGMR